VTRFERRFLARVARYGGLVFAGLTWLVLVVYAARRLDSLDLEASLAVSARDLALLIRFLDVALGVSALIGAALAVTDLRRRGVLASFGAAGMRSRHILRPVLVVATFVLAMSTLMHEGFFRLEARSTGGARPVMWKLGDAWIWAPGGGAPGTDIEPVVFFSARGLDLSRVERARWDSGANAFNSLGAVALAGGGVDIERFPPPPRLDGPFKPTSIRSLFASGTPLRSTLAFLNRLALAPLLVVVVAYSVLLGATRRPAGLALLAVGIPAVVFMNVLTVKLLWTAPAIGLMAQAVWSAVAAAALLGPIILFHRRGPRFD